MRTSTRSVTTTDKVIPISTGHTPSGGYYNAWSLVQGSGTLAMSSFMMGNITSNFRANTVTPAATISTNSTGQGAYYQSPLQLSNPDCSNKSAIKVDFESPAGTVIGSNNPWQNLHSYVCTGANCCAGYKWVSGNNGGGDDGETLITTATMVDYPVLQTITTGQTICLQRVIWWDRPGTNPDRAVLAGNQVSCTGT